MAPSQAEIDAVGDAFISLSFQSYTKEQQECLNRFLNQYAASMDSTEIDSLFKELPETIEAIKELNKFANEFHEKEIYQEFKEEVDDLLINLNGQNGGFLI